MEPWWSRPPAAPDEPGICALVVAVSRYANLPPAGAPAPEEWMMGLHRLESAASSGAEFARWLRTEHRLPDTALRAIWLLLSPAEAEAGNLLADEAAAPRATRENVRAAVVAWRTACRTSRDNVAVLYAAGHGLIQHRFEPGVLLLEDYGSNPDEGLLQGALNLTAIHGHMAGDPDGPERQFGFFDACRPRPAIQTKRDLGQAPPQWDVPLRPRARASAMFVGAVADSLAYGQPGSRTVFWQALQECLQTRAVRLMRGRGAGDQDGWGVTDDELEIPLRERVTELLRDADIDQEVGMLPQAGGAAFHVPADPPEAVRTFRVTPAAAGPAAFATLRHDEASDPVFEDVSMVQPVTRPVPSGTYDIHVAIRPATAEYRETTRAEFIDPQGPPEIPIDVRPPGT